MPNAREKRFIDNIARLIDLVSLGAIYGKEYEGRKDFQIHHVKGRTFKHNKIHIGEYFAIPVPVELHDVHSNNELSVTHHKNAFTAKFGLQRDIWLSMFELMCAMEVETPSQEVIDSISDVYA